MSKQTMQTQVFDNSADLFATAAERFVRQAGRAVALSGGSTPRAVFSLLKDEPYRNGLDWKSLNVYWSDERCVPPDDSQSNYRMAYEALLSHVPAEHVFRMKGELEPARAAAEYEVELPAEPLDLVLLGMGPDGHTASLFPHTAALHESARRVAANYVQKMESWRLTLTAPELQRAQAVLFLVTGADKAAAVREVVHGDYRPDEYPAQLLREARGEVTLLLDRAAAAGL
ncbi:MAG: 6-phosphogluconolactonase [Chloroflexota bacterium]